MDPGVLAVVSIYEGYDDQIFHQKWPNLLPFDPDFAVIRFASNEPSSSTPNYRSYGVLLQRWEDLTQ